MAIKLTSSGSFTNTKNFFKKSEGIRSRVEAILKRYGPIGVEALENATPSDTGLTAKSWSWSIEKDGIYFYNTNNSQSIPIVILIQYGHGTGSGGYVQPRDFINPALQPIYDKIQSEIDREVSNL